MRFLLERWPNFILWPLIIAFAVSRVWVFLNYVDQMRIRERDAARRAK